jgi:glutamate dehydrogenase/leucine dehydrogenase
MTDAVADPVLQREFEHEQLHVVHDARSGLTGVVAIHSTVRGPAAGGVRLSRYASLDAATEDALRLSRAMTLKSSAAGLELGGGKSVLLDDGQWADPDLRRARMHAFARVLERLGGCYIAAEDVGTTPEDMETIAEVTRHVAGRPGASGDPSGATARTVFAAIEDAVALRLDRGLRDVSVGVLGAGNVGRRLALLLARAGARVVVTDIDPLRAKTVAAESAAMTAPLQGFIHGKVDVLAPCALGGAIATLDVDRLSCSVVCGAANNPLASDDVATALHAAGILYVPDFLANCGGIIQIASEVLGFDEVELDRRIEAAIARTRETLAEAAASGQLPLDVAKQVAAEGIAGDVSDFAGAC